MHLQDKRNKIFVVPCSSAFMSRKTWNSQHVWAIYNKKNILIENFVSYHLRWQDSYVMMNTRSLEQNPTRHGTVNMPCLSTIRKRFFRKISNYHLSICWWTLGVKKSLHAMRNMSWCSTLRMQVVQVITFNAGGLLNFVFGIHPTKTSSRHGTINMPWYLQLQKTNSSDLNKLSPSNSWWALGVK